MNREAMMQLRQAIAQSAQELAMKDGHDPVAQLELLMELVRSDSSSPEVIRRAYELAGQLADDEEKLTVYLDLLAEVDIYLAQQDDAQAPSATV